ncbi:MAG: SufE family protein [Bdellovibrionales bacterium]|nr:SufE family protein [Bdellovibrionales bacterium]
MSSTFDHDQSFHRDQTFDRDQARFEQIESELAALDDWEDRYAYIIELGRGLPTYPEVCKTDHYRLHGCQSQVWLLPLPRTELDRFEFIADSDSSIVRGLIAILRSLFNDRAPTEILALDEQKLLAAIGLHTHLSPGRRNGLRSLVTRIKAHAAAMLETSQLAAANS